LATPHLGTKLEGREMQMFVERDRKMEEERRQRQLRRQIARERIHHTRGLSSEAGLN